MIGFVARRTAQSAATMLVAVVLIFIAVRVLPGNPVLSKFGQHVDAAQVAKLKAEQGWDQPIYLQLFNFFHQIMTTGSLGESLARANEDVTEELRQRVPATVELTLAAMMIAIPVGLIAGVLAAVRRNRFLDFFCMTGSLLGVSTPVFFLGICLRAAFPNMPPGFRLPHDVFDFEPLTGLFVLDTLLRGRWELLGPAITHLCLPAMALSSIPMSIIARVTRTSMLEVLSADYVRTAKSKGSSPLRTVFGHALPNAAVPVVNIVGLQVGLLLSGAVLTETVFDWPGLGKYMVDALLINDYVVAQAGALVIAAMFVGINLILDLLFAWFDPRIRQTVAGPAT